MRYLALNYGSDKNENENYQLTEEEWLIKEQKEIEEVEKTVSIRFANYTTMMRAHSLTAGLNAQLAMFLRSLGREGGIDQIDKKEDQTELTKKLLLNAGIKDVS